MFTDALIMDKTWDAPGGFLGFSARFARTGIQMYSGAEIDPDGAHKLADGSRKFAKDTLYPVDRPASEVFKPSAMASFIGKPLTNDHPTDGVTIDNWRGLADGVIAEVLRDGEHARMSGLMTDKKLIADYRAGKKELSAGYEATLLIGDGVNDKGEPFVAQQTNIDGNHTAFVNRGRAGSGCAVIDAAHCDAAPRSFLDSLTTQEKPVKTMLIDGLTVDIANADTAHATITTILAARDGALAKVTGLETQVATLTTDKATLEAEVKKLTDAKPTPAQLRDAAKQFAIVTDKAKALGVTVTDTMGEAEIKKAAVLKHVGDAAKDWSEQMIDASFATLKDGKPDLLRDAIGNQPTVVTDSRTFYEDSRARQRGDLSQAWRGTPKVEAA